MRIYRKDAPFFLLYMTILIVLMFVVIFGILPLIDSLKPEYPYSADLTNGKRVAFEIVDLDPTYSASSTLICSTHLSGGEQVWLLLSSGKYKKLEGAKTSWFGSMQTYAALTFSKPVKVHGKMRDADDVGIKGLEARIGAPKVVYVNSIES